MSRLASLALVAGSAVAGLLLGSLDSYILFPISRVGRPLTDFASQLPGGGSAQEVHFLVWCAIALVAFTLGLVIILVSPSTKERDPRRWTVIACLLSFGVPLGVTWVSMILVGQAMYRYMPDAPLGRTGWDLWYTSFLGWIAVVFSFALMLRESARRHRS